MLIKYDDDSEIAMFHIYEFLSNAFDSAIRKNGDGETLLRKSGISSLCDLYDKELTPFSYNGKWQNDNMQYNPQKVFFELYPELDDKHKFFFLKSIIENANFYKIDQNKTNNYLTLLGYSLMDDSDTKSGYTLSQTTKGLIKRGADITLLESKLKNEFPDLFRFYDEALSTFGNGEYKSCIDNCRSLFEKLTEAIGNDKTDRAVFKITGEEVKDGTTILLTKEKIYKYWLEHKKGANRYRYFTTLYSIMSGLGTHGEDIPKKADAVMILRATEDALVWILKI